MDFSRCANQYGIPNYFAFLLTRERVKANGALKLITVKMRWAPNEDSQKQDDENSFDNGDLGIEESKANAKGNNEASDSKMASKWKLKFDYVSTLMPKIDNFRGDK